MPSSNQCYQRYRFKIKHFLNIFDVGAPTNLKKTLGEFLIDVYCLKNNRSPSCKGQGVSTVV
jgi:hypothetical protein